MRLVYAAASFTLNMARTCINVQAVSASSSSCNSRLFGRRSAIEGKAFRQRILPGVFLRLSDPRAHTIAFPPTQKRLQVRSSTLHTRLANGSWCTGNPTAWLPFFSLSLSLSLSRSHTHTHTHRLFCVEIVQCVDIVVSHSISWIS